MNAKYVECYFPRWFVFGEHHDGLVDLCDSEGDVVPNVTREQAAILIRERDRIVDALIAAIGGEVGSGARLERAIEAAKSAKAK